MKSRKNYGRKIKRNKLNLYTKRKTKAQKILYTIFAVILLLGLVFFGYCLGKPLLEYFENNASLSDTPEWTPPEEDTEPSQTSAPSEMTAVPVETTLPAGTEAPEESGRTYAVGVPSSALANSPALSAFAAKSAADGFTAAVVLLKDNDGNVRYASELEQLKGSDAVTGTLTAEEISRILTENGLTPFAAISVLSDNAGCIANPDMSYKLIDEETVSWLDYTKNPPVRWVNPESRAAADYVTAMINELKAAGFSEIIQTNIVFPDFQEYDRSYIAGKYFSADRYKMLTRVIAENAYIEVNAADVLSGTAEVLKNKELKNKILVRISKEDFPAEKGYPASASSLLEVIMSKASSKYSGFRFSPLISGTDFSAAELEEMQKISYEMGYTEFFIG